MTILTEEIPFTNQAIKIYIEEAERRIEVLRPSAQEFDRLKTRLKLANKRLEQHSISVPESTHQKDHT